MRAKDFKQASDEMLVALEQIRTVASHRQNRNALWKIQRLYEKMMMYDNVSKHPANDAVQRQFIRTTANKALELVDQIKLPIKLEIREVLFPLPDIKRAAHELGTQLYPDYLQWTDGETDVYKLLEMLEGDLDLLEQAEKLITSALKRI